MQRGHQVANRPALEMPPGFDPSGIPCVGAVAGRSASAARRRRSHPLPGLPPTIHVASVMEVIPREAGDWLVWGCVDARPMLFAVEPASAAEMAHAVAAGEHPTAIVEPAQVLLEPLD